MDREFSVNHLSSLASHRDSTPGSLIPCMYSREAPPPVETKETSLSAFLLMTRRAVSPPPITEVAPSLVRLVTLLRTPSLPLAKLGNSKTPMGPFQKIELARWMTLSKSSTDLGPLSKISQPSGTSALSQMMV
jgi:hypothetical protein